MKRSCYVLSSVFSAMSFCFLFLAVVLSCSPAFAAGSTPNPRCDLCIGTCNGSSAPCTGTCVVDSSRTPPQCGQNVTPVYTCTCKPLAGSCGCD